MAARASSFLSVVDDRSTYDGAEVAVGDTKGDLSVNLVTSGNPDPPSC